MKPGKQANQPEVCLPAPLARDRFDLLRDGISDDPKTSVLINAARDFAYLTPQPVVDYTHYQPRWRKLGLPAQSRKDEVLRRRAAKIAPHLAGASTLLEIGAGDASFLDLIRQLHPGLRLSCCEPDQNTRPQRDERAWLDQYDDWNEVSDRGIAFAVVALFHVFEHFADPAAFLGNCRGWLNVGGHVIVEVPSLTDPAVVAVRGTGLRSVLLPEAAPVRLFGGVRRSRARKRGMARHRHGTVPAIWAVPTI